MRVRRGADPPAGCRNFHLFFGIFNKILIRNGTLMHIQMETKIFSHNHKEILLRYNRSFIAFCCFTVANQRHLSISNRNGLTKNITGHSQDIMIEKPF